MKLSRTQFNKEAVKKMSFSEFEKLYKGKFDGEQDLKKVFQELGGNIKKDYKKSED